MNALQKFIAARPFGFITTADVPELIKLHRLCQVLVRCGGCRFTCAVQDVAFLIKSTDAGGDYVRDVSITSREMETAASWQPEPSLKRAEPVKVLMPPPTPQHMRCPRCEFLFHEEECNTRRDRTFPDSPLMVECPKCNIDFIHPSETEPPAGKSFCKTPTPAQRAHDDYLHTFNENDCGGVFDGNGVISDADSGL